MELSAIFTPLSPLATLEDSVWVVMRRLLQGSFSKVSESIIGQWLCRRTDRTPRPCGERMRAWWKFWEPDSRAARISGPFPAENERGQKDKVQDGVGQP